MKDKAYVVMFTLALWLFDNQTFASDNLEPLSIKVAFYDEHVRVVSQTLSQQPCENIDDYFQNNNQVIMEAVLLCQSLVLAGYRPKIEFEGYPIQERIAREIIKGHILMAGFGMWQRHYNKEHMYLSSELLKKGEFEKGLYASQKNAAIFLVNNFSELVKFHPVSNRNWLQDWQALECAGFTPKSTNNMPNMFNLVEKGRADFMITTFSIYDDLHQTHFGAKLVPVPGYKIVIDQSLNFMVSRDHPQGKLVAEAIEVGLAKLRKEGVIINAYRQLGFFLDKVKDWQPLGCI